MVEKNIFDDVLEEYVNPILARGQVSMSNDMEIDSLRETLITLLDNRHSSNNVDGSLLDSIDRRFSYLRIVHDGDFKLLDSLNTLEKDSYIMILNTIEEYCDFKLNLEDGDMLFDNLKPLVQDMYSFFVEDYAANLIVTFHSYIITNEEDNARKFSITAKTKDLGLNSMKDKFQKDTIGMITLHHLSDIMEMAISEFKADDMLMLEYVCTYDEDEITFMKMRELFIYDETDEDNTGIPVGVLGSNFVDVFLSPLVDIDSKMKLKSSLDNLLTEEYINMNS